MPQFLAKRRSNGALWVGLLFIGALSFITLFASPVSHSAAQSSPPTATSAPASDPLAGGIVLRIDKPAVSLRAFLATANARKLASSLQKRLSFFATLLQNTPLPKIDGTDLRLIVVDAVDLAGSKLDILPVLRYAPDQYIVAGVGGGWIKYGPLQGYTIRFVKNVEQTTFYPVYQNSQDPTKFLPVVQDIAPVVDDSGSIAYRLADGTVLGVYNGRYIRETSTGFMLNVSQDVGQYVEKIKGKELFHYGWQAYKMPAQNTAARWRILPDPSIDDITFFKGQFDKLLKTNQSYIQSALQQVILPPEDQFDWTAPNIDKAIGGYKFPGSGSARPILLDSGTVDISLAFFAKHMTDITFATGSLDTAVKYTQDTYHVSYTKDQVKNAVLYPFVHANLLSVYDRFRFASALTVSETGRFAPLEINILSKADMPPDAAAYVQGDGSFYMNADFIDSYIRYPGSVDGLLSHEIGGHYIEIYSAVILGYTIRPILDNTLSSDTAFDTIEPFNYLRTIHDDADLLLSHKVPASDLNYELFVIGEVLPFVKNNFGDSSR